MKRRDFFRQSLALIASGITAPFFGQSLMSISGSGNNPADQSQLLKETASQRAAWAKGLTLATQSKIMPITYQEEFNTAGYLPADGLQQWCAMAQCESNPNYIMGVQDTGGVWMSNDHGVTWRRPKRSGLLSYLGVGCEFDPLDPKRVFILTGGSFLVCADYEGLYLSTDGGLNFSRKTTVNQANGHATFSAIAYAPSSKNTTLGKTQRWYCFNPSETLDGVIIHKSDDYGENFTLVRSISKSTYGAMAYARVHPTNQAIVYTVGSKGLVRFDDASSSSGAIETMSGKNNLPSGSIGAPPYISPDGSTIIVGVGGKGIYKTTNAGDTWTKIGSESTFGKLWVNPWNENHMIITYGESGSNLLPKYSTNGGTSFTTASTMQKRPGNTSAVKPNHGSTFICFHSRAGQVFYAARQVSTPSANCNYRSSDYGANWILSMAGFNGAQLKTFSSPQMFDPIDKNRFAFPMVDIGIWLTSTGGKWFHPNTMKASPLGLTEVSQNGVALHPDASKKTILSLPEGGGKLTLAGSYDDGLTWTLLVGDTVTSKCAYVCFDPADPSFAFWNRYRSNNHGAIGSWSVMNALPSGWGLWAASLQDPSGLGLFAIDTANYMNFRRSTDHGDTWIDVLQMPHNVKSIGAVWGLTIAHPYNRDILFTMGNPGHTIWKWDLSSGTPSTRSYEPLNIFGSGATPPKIGTPILIDKMAVDPRYPDIMYVSTCYGGSSYRLFRTTDGGATAWDNISDLVPTCCNYNALEVSPVTGDVIFSGSNGIFVIEPPYEQEGTLYSGLGQENYLQNTEWVDKVNSVQEIGIDKKKVVAYPNPTNGLVNIDLGDVFQKIELVVRNVSGKKIQSEKFNQRQILSFNLKGPSGVYVLTIVTETLKVSLEVIKN